ncbi:MAG: sigma factor-like helix-turn-helix DNA-binding protein [Mobilitalea sp.]
MSDKIRIRLLDYYTETVGEDEYVYVSKEVYEALTNTFRKEAHAEHMKDYRNRTREGYVEGVTENFSLKEGRSVEEQVICSLELKILQTAMQTLTAIQKERLRLYFFEGLTSREIADRQGVRQNAVWKSIQGAIESLKKFF